MLGEKGGRETSDITLFSKTAGRGRSRTMRVAAAAAYPAYTNLFFNKARERL
jgi:hypothetical protein